MLRDACAMQIGDRMAAHADAVMDVASRSVGQAIGDSTGARRQLCDGLLDRIRQSRPDLLLAKKLGLRSDLRRTFIGHMGCYAALNVIKVAMDSVAARPEELVICNCTELSSAHVRDTPMPDGIQRNPDHAGPFRGCQRIHVVGSAPDGAGIQFLRTHTEQLDDHHERRV